MKKPLFFLALFILFFKLPSFALCADNPDQYLAHEIGNGIIAAFRPESITIRVDYGRKLAWIEATGAIFDKVRVEKMELFATLREIPANFNLSDKDALAKLISSSKGEVLLLERDVNAYFASSNSVSGFSRLTFAFSEKGFKAEGNYSADFLFGLSVKLAAFGRLGLRADGVYLEDTTIRIGEHLQSDSLSSLIVERINPLLSFNKNPFPIEFNKINMTKSAVKMTGGVRPLSSGYIWKWQKP